MPSWSWIVIAAIVIAAAWRLKSSLQLFKSGMADVESMDTKEYTRFIGQVLRQSGATNVSMMPQQGLSLLMNVDADRFGVATYQEQVTVAMVRQTISAAENLKLKHLMMVTTQHFSAGAASAAQSAGVVMWDKETLSQRVDQLQHGQHPDLRDDRTV